MSSFNKVDMIHQMMYKIRNQRAEILDDCIQRYADHIGCDPKYLTVTHRLHYHPEVVKLVNNGGEVIFEVYDPIFKYTVDTLSALDPEVITATLTYKEFWKDE